MKKICLNCDLLGECKTVTLEMLSTEKGCGSWKCAKRPLIKARNKAVAIAGPIALKSMLIKDLLLITENGGN